MRDIEDVVAIPRSSCERDVAASSRHPRDCFANARMVVNGSLQGGYQLPAMMDRKILGDTYRIQKFLYMSPNFPMSLNFIVRTNGDAQHQDPCMPALTSSIWPLPSRHGQNRCRLRHRPHRGAGLLLPSCLSAAVWRHLPFSFSLTAIAAFHRHRP